MDRHPWTAMGTTGPMGLDVDGQARQTQGVERGTTSMGADEPRGDGRGRGRVKALGCAFVLMGAGVFACVVPSDPTVVAVTRPADPSATPDGSASGAGGDASTVLRSDTGVPPSGDPYRASEPDPDGGTSPRPPFGTPGDSFFRTQPSTQPGGLRWVGRAVATSATTALWGWQGAGVVAVVGGRTLRADLETDGYLPLYVQAIVDGKAVARIKVEPGAPRTHELASGLSDGDHIVELYRDTEGGYGTLTFGGFSEGTLKGAPAATGRTIEVVGDSISAGFGNLGKETHLDWTNGELCDWSTENSTWYETYGALAGRALGAEVSSVAVSGYGMNRGYGNVANDVLPRVFDRALGPLVDTRWEFKSSPDVVVINLGTNDVSAADGADPGLPYETAYLAFLEKLRGWYPKAWIFLTIGPMVDGSALKAVNERLARVVAAREKVGDRAVVAFELGVQNLGTRGEIPSGCNWHPTVAEHRRMAGILVQKFALHLGWR